MLQRYRGELTLLGGRGAGELLREVVEERLLLQQVLARAGSGGAADLVHALRKHFDGSDLISVPGEGDEALAAGKIEPEALNHSDKMELRVFGNDKRGHAVLVARLDNLGKGASGAAVQNLKLMLGLS